MRTGSAALRTDEGLDDIVVACGMTPTGRRCATGVKPSVERRLMPAFFAVRRERPAARSRGLMNSSMPKLSNARPVPSRAMQIPGGAHHHHQPPRTALLAKPSRNISPQFHSPGGEDVGEPASPRNAMATYAPIAESAVKRNDAATIGIKLGRTSTRMIRAGLSPETLAASTKSRLRSERVCALRVREV